MKCAPTLFTLLIATLFIACKDDQLASPQDGTNSYIEDNIFGCSQFEVMDTEETFFSNVPAPLEVFHQFFVYGGTDNLVIRDGFNGPVLQTVAMSVNDLVLFDNQLMICAEEGVYRMDPSGELSTISDYRCNTMVLDGLGRLLLQGGVGPEEWTTAYHIQEFKDGMITPFAPVAPYVNCVTLDLFSGDEESLYALSCNNDIIHYENGNVVGEYSQEEAPFSAEAASTAPLLTVYHDGGLIVMAQSVLDFFRMYKLSNQEWQPLYDLTYENTDTEKNREVFLHIESNLLLHDDFLYAFDVGDPKRGNGIVRYDLSGDGQKTLDDIQLIALPGLSSRDIIDMVMTSDGHAYAVLNSRKIVRLTC
jgi:hypothetical protein